MEKKKIMLIALFSLLAIGIATASLLQYFGQVKTTANVEQSVILLEVDEHTIPEPAPDGEKFCYLQKLKNRASVNISVWLTTTCRNATITNGGSCPEIITGTNFYEVKDERTLNLCAKDSEKDSEDEWQCTAGATATLTFDPVNPKFKGTLSTTGLSSGTDYALIYYPDKLDRFASDKWNGAGGKVITTFNGDVTNLAIDTDLGVNLPDGTLPDWNINPDPDYCDLHNTFDSYVHCKGAKLWIVKTSDLTGGTTLPLVRWNPDAWLFEEDLIVYSDCDLDSMEYVVDMELQEDGLGNNGKLTTISRAITPFVVCYDFPIGTYEGEYTLTTDVLTSDPEGDD